MLTIKSISKSVSSGLTPLRTMHKYWNNGTIPWLKTGEVGEYEIWDTEEKISEYALSDTSISLNPADTVTVAMYGQGKTRGSVSVLRKPMTTNQACCNIVLDEDKYSAGFLYYYLKTQYRALRELSSGVRQNLNTGDIERYEVPDRPLPTQQAIAAVLTSLDDKIALNKKVNAELEQMMRDVYDYWFVQFDFPDANDKPYKSSGGKMVYNEVLGREIPEGWEVKKIADLLNITSSKNIRIDSKRILPNGKYPVITQELSDFISGFADEANPIIDVPTIIFGDHSCSIKYINFPFFRGADGTKVLRFKNNSIIYIYLYLKNQISRIPNFRKYERHFKYLKEFQLVLPSDEVLNCFNSSLSMFFDKITANNMQSQHLAKLRDFLLPMLMNGQLEVKL